MVSKFSVLKHKAIFLLSVGIFNFFQHSVVANNNNNLFIDEEFFKQANISKEQLQYDREIYPANYWESVARENISWFKPWTQLTQEDGLCNTKWFINGKLNLSYNCLDRHIKKGGGEKIAYIYYREDGHKEVWTYNQLLSEVNKIANLLISLNVKKGDIVAIYMPTMPESIATMLAVTRIGAAHTVIFGGTACDSIRSKVNDSEAKLIITAEGTFRGGNFINYVDQLPSVGAGNFLNDVIASGVIKCIKLKQIFRQAQDSMIIVNAHKVNNGEFPVSTLPDAKKDFIFIKEENPELVQAHLEHIFKQGLRRFGISNDQAMVLVPMNRGSVGTQKINYDLQQLLNPGNTEKQLSYAGTTYKESDRVMQIRNNYDKQVFNGDMGVIAEIDVGEKLIMVQYPDLMVEYEYSELSELVLAYAISIHKSQGSEYPAAIIPIFMQHFTLLQRNLIYTAITRAKKLCILIGQPKAIAMAIKNNKGLERTTFLQEYLTTDLQCR